MTHLRTDWLTQSWLQRGAIAWLLRPLAWLYGAVVWIRSMAYRTGWLRQHHLPVPVVVIGNVVVGGAGKTPTVIAVVSHLQKQGHRPGVISRGHGRSTDPLEPQGRRGAVVEVGDRVPAALTGDEPLLIRQATGVPVFVARQRAVAGKALLEAHPDTTVLVCDDGLQHLSLAIDVGIAVFDERGVGNGWLLPAGLLREPWPPTIPGRVNMVLHAVPSISIQNSSLQVPAGMPVFNGAKQLASHVIGLDGERVPLADLMGRPLLALAGIAKPDSFFNMLRDAGLTLAHTVPFPDHHKFDVEFCSTILNTDKREDVIFTEKDAVKLFPLLREARTRAGSPTLSVRFWAVPLTMDIDSGLFACLDQQLSSKYGHEIA